MPYGDFVVILSGQGCGHLVLGKLPAAQRTGHLGEATGAVRFKPWNNDTAKLKVSTTQSCCFIVCLFLGNWSRALAGFSCSPRVYWVLPNLRVTASFVFFFFFFLSHCNLSSCMWYWKKTRSRSREGWVLVPDKSWSWLWKSRCLAEISVPLQLRRALWAQIGSMPGNCSV